MSDNKLNSLGFDEDDFLSNLEFLKAKYSAYDDEDSKKDTETEKNVSEKDSIRSEETSADVFTYERGNNNDLLPNLGEESYDGEDIYSEHTFTFDNEKGNSKEIKTYEKDLYDETVIVDGNDVFSYEKDEDADAIPEIANEDEPPAWYLSGSIDYDEEDISDEPETQEDAPADEVKEPIEEIYSNSIKSESLSEEDGNPPAWYLSDSMDYGEERISDESKTHENAPAEDIAQKNKNIADDIYSQPNEDKKSAPEEAKYEADEFSDLDDDDDIKVIKQGEKSPFVAAFMDAASKANNEDDFSEFKSKKIKAKKEKPLKAPKKAKAEKENNSAKWQKSKKRKIITLVIAVAIPVIIWLSIFLTDIILVKNWYTPFFSVEAKTYSDGSSTYVGAFYKIQFHVNEDNTEEIDRECLPWFVNGPNDK